MKTLISFFVTMMVMLVACNKDQFVQDEPLLLKKAKVAIPMKADFCFTPDLTLPPVHINGLPWTDPAYFLPGGGWMSGNATHMGELIMEESALTVLSASFDPNTGIVTWLATGKATAANGDYYYYDATTYVNPDKSFTGPVKMRDGVGKFEGATGTVQMVGQGTCWHAEGTMSFEQ